MGAPEGGGVGAEGAADGAAGAAEPGAVADPVAWSCCTRGRRGTWSAPGRITPGLFAPDPWLVEPDGRELSSSTHPPQPDEQRTRRTGKMRRLTAPAFVAAQSAAVEPSGAGEPVSYGAPPSTAGWAPQKSFAAT